MYSFLANIIMLAALAVMIYLLARALPRVSDLDHETITHTTAFDRAIDKLPMEKLDTALSSSLQRMLEQFKLIVHKIDTMLNNYLSQVKKHSPAHKEQHGAVLREKMEAMSETKEPVEKSHHSK